jgi:hypothetical protein
MSRRARPDIRPLVDRVDLNDLFALFPALPGFRHRPLADQRRLVREKSNGCSPSESQRGPASGRRGTDQGGVAGQARG